MNYLETDIILKGESGLHARPAGILAKTANKYKSKVELEKNGNKKNAKSIMSLLTLGAASGDKLRLIVDGEDAEIATKEIIELFELNFKE